ncbi:DUF1766-domain-containing protein [Ramicandelaber brevisporus]|nr:DUF1766-domain-containing protein [Ramicandelaber brevisporus]
MSQQTCKAPKAKGSSEQCPSPAKYYVADFDPHYFCGRHVPAQFKDSATPIAVSSSTPSSPAKPAKHSQPPQPSPAIESPSNTHALQKLQCSGVKADGSRCSRMCYNDTGRQTVLYCSSHRDQMLPEPSASAMVTGYISGKLHHEGSDDNNVSTATPAPSGLAVAVALKPKLNAGLQAMVDSIHSKRVEQNTFLYNFVHNYPDNQRVDFVDNMSVAKKFIDPSLSRSAQAKVLEILTAPASSADTPGFIYCFQHYVTPSTRALIRSLLQSVASGAFESLAQTMEKLRIGSGRSAADRSPDVLYKIGKAVNVSKRMIQWSRQCQMPIDLLEVFPEQPKAQRSLLLDAFTRIASQDQNHDDNDSSSTASRGMGETYDFPSATRTKKVGLAEALIHAHLSDESFGNVPISCHCGTRHKEWFKDNDGIRWPHTNIRLVIQYYIKLIKLGYDMK